MKLWKEKIFKNIANAFISSFRQSGYFVSWILDVWGLKSYEMKKKVDTDSKINNKKTFNDYVKRVDLYLFLSIKVGLLPPTLYKIANGL